MYKSHIQDMHLDNAVMYTKIIYSQIQFTNNQYLIKQ